MKKFLTQRFYRKVFILIVLFSNVCINSAKAQYVNIPDSMFRVWLTNHGFASCMSGNMLDTTCTAVINANTIVCKQANIHDLTGIEYFHNLTYLDCSVNFLTSLPLLPDSLETLLCWYNHQLTFLTNLPSSLKALYCNGDSMTALPALPPALQELYCGSNLLTSLPILPTSLTRLDCTNNFITSLPNLPPSLTNLWCINNLLTSLPVLPATLDTLRCNWNQISALPNLPSSLTYLSCDNNPLFSLPTLPPSLIILSCCTDSLTSLPSLPLSLTDLSCGINQLTVLPTLPPSLYMLQCQYNQLTQLPTLPNSLKFLACFNNQLTSLPDLPDTLSDAIIAFNPISCLPKIKFIDYLDWHGTDISCLPNLGVIQQPDPAIYALPLCQLSEQCPIFWNISGSVFFDNNGNCVNDTNDIPLHFIPVVLDSAGVQLQRFVTDGLGRYAFNADTGSYSIRIDTSSTPYQVLCPSTFYQNVSLFQNNLQDTLIDFGLQCKNGFDLIAHNISPAWAFTPGDSRLLYLEVGDAMQFFANVSCANGVAGSVQVILNGPAAYISPASGALMPTTIQGDTITWNVNDFSQINPNSSFNINVQVDTSATLNDSICIQLNVLPVAGDIQPANNFLTACYPVNSSFDPNEKCMYPAGLVDTSIYWFTYTIFFQNTGNATAQRIYLLDTLDQNLDASTFTFISSTHNVITQLLPGNILRFNYPNIQLPDSGTNEPASHGFVQFKIKRKAGLAINTSIHNTAYIYFDYNSAVITNTTSATLTISSGISNAANNNLQFSVYPNPSCDKITVYNYHFNAGDKFTIRVVNMVGKELLNTSIQSPQYTIPVKNYTNGIYLLFIETNSGNLVKKLIKQ